MDAIPPRLYFLVHPKHLAVQRADQFLSLPDLGIEQLHLLFGTALLAPRFGDQFAGFLDLGIQCVALPFQLLPALCTGWKEAGTADQGKKQEPSPGP
jgi:hypothetical protein